MAEVRRYRRYCLLKRLASRSFNDRGLEFAWQSKQEEVDGTALPSTFPSKDALEAVGYSTAEDIDGADCRELLENVGLNQRQAQAVIAAASALL